MMEILKDMGTQVFVDRVLHIATHTVPNMVYKAYLRRGVETFTQQQLEGQIADALRRELVDAEAPLVERELYAGHSQPVSDVTLRNKEYVRQVDVEVDGIKHTYYQAPDGTWCRHSGGEPICELSLGPEVSKAEKDLMHAGGAAPSPTAPTLKEPEFKEITKVEYDKLTPAQQQEYLGRWMKEHNVERIYLSEKHHA